MNKLLNKRILKQTRQKLRNQQTAAESVLWGKLRKKQLLGTRFHRQYSIGPFILDFYCPKARLGIELDGKYHEDPKQNKYDISRERAVKSIEIEIIRFSNNRVISDLSNVISEIECVVKRRTSSSPL